MNKSESAHTVELETEMAAKIDSIQPKSFEANDDNAELIRRRARSLEMMFDHNDEERKELDAMSDSLSSSSSCSGDADLKKILDERSRGTRLLPSVIQYRRKKKKLRAKELKQAAIEAAKRQKLQLLEEGVKWRRFDKANGFIISKQANEMYQSMKQNDLMIDEGSVTESEDSDPEFVDAQPKKKAPVRQADSSSDSDYDLPIVSKQAQPKGILAV